MKTRSFDKFRLVNSTWITTLSQQFPDWKQQQQSMYKECLFSSYKNRAEKFTDVGTESTCQPVISCKYPDKLYSPETRMIVLPETEDRTIISSFVLTKHRNVMDRQTDRSAVAIAWSNTVRCTLKIYFKFSFATLLNHC